MTRRRKSRDEAPGWAWMLLGLAIGLVVALGVYVNGRRPQGEPASSIAAPSPMPTDAADSARPSTPDRARVPVDERFGFYELLPRYEVVVPELETAAPVPSRAQAIAEPGNYVLQAGSFATEADAERQRARLGLLGIESRIQRVIVDDREFHRVRIGPLDDLDELNSIRRRLLDAQVESLLMRMTD